MEMTTLDGALIRRDGKWYWSDGTLEPRVRDMPLARLAPSWRCVTYGSGRTYVEVPRGWRKKVSDHHVLVAVEYLVERCGKTADIFAEGLAEALEYHRISVPGYLIPIEEWDRIMSGPIGAEWDIDDEPDILARAKKLNEQEEIAMTMKKIWLLFDEGHEVLGVYSNCEAAEADIPNKFGRRLTPEEIADRGDGAPYEGGTPVIEEWDEKEARELYPALFR